VIIESLNYLKKKQDERDEKVNKSGSSVETLKMSSEIRTKIDSVERELENLASILRRQKKKPQVSIFNSTTNIEEISKERYRS